MLNDDMYKLGSKRSTIRELFEFGKTRAKEIGKENVFDFSLGNPSIPAPKCVNQSISSLLDTLDDASLHGYTSAQGNQNVRHAVAMHIEKTQHTQMSEDYVYMTCGATSSLCITLRALCEKDDEFIILAPYFPEYKVFIGATGAKCVVVPFNECDFTPNLDALDKAITKNTKAIIVNSPNNPSGAVYSQKTIDDICAIVNKKQTLYSKEIFIISDEPYREIVYDVAVPSILKAYDNAIVCYSYSKSLSLSGERIGYIAVNPRAKDADKLYLAICGASRALGYVCAPSTYQRVIQACADALPDIEEYRKNRNILYSSLKAIGYECVLPSGAFYLMLKSLEDDSEAFSQRAKDFGILVVPADDFGAKGYVRIAYCVNTKMIERSIPAFKALFDSYK